MDQPTADLIARVNRADVSKNDLLLFSGEVHKLPSHERDWEGRVICAIGFFDGDSDKAMAAMWRMEALAKLIESGVLANWSRPCDDGDAQMTAEPVFLAAATEPVLFTGKGAIFDSDSFLKAVLEYSEVEGQS